MHRVVSALALLVSASAGTAGVLPLALQCERQWIVDSGRVTFGHPEADAILTRQWVTREAECGATSVYWGRLAILQARSRDFAGADSSLRRAPTGDAQHDFVLDLARVEVGVQRRLASTTPLTRIDLQEFETGYAKVASKYPNWPTAYAMLGGVQTTLGKHSEAVASLRKASKGDAYQLSGVFRHLTVSLSSLGEHEAALAAADRAGELDKSLLGDTAFVIAVARSHIALGYLDDARDALQVIMAKRPEVKTDPEFVQVLESYERSRGHK